MRIRPIAWSVSAVILATSCSGGLSGVLKKPTPVTATTAVTADRGSMVFSDDFTDSGSGWTRESVADFSATFTKSGYVIVARGFVDHEIASPYSVPKQQLSVSMTATESTDSPSESGFGAGCDRGLSESTVSYDFVVMIDGTWEIRRHDTRPGAASASSLLKKGTSPKAPGAASITVELMCATLSDGVTTRLLTFVSGTDVADITDRVDDLPRLGWLGAFVVRGEGTRPTTVTATYFELRDLTG